MRELACAFRLSMSWLSSSHSGGAPPPSGIAQELDSLPLAELQRLQNDGTLGVPSSSTPPSLSHEVITHLLGDALNALVERLSAGMSREHASLVEIVDALQAGNATLALECEQVHKDTVALRRELDALDADIAHARSARDEAAAKVQALASKDAPRAHIPALRARAQEIEDASEALSSAFLGGEGPGVDEFLKAYSAQRRRYHLAVDLARVLQSSSS